MKKIFFKILFILTIKRDLKPENLLLDKKMNIKMIDFGLSNLYDKEQLLDTACGSPCYAAPEMLERKKYRGITVDIWSSGVVLFSMLCGYLPFQDQNNTNLYKKIKQGLYEIPDFLSKNSKSFLTNVLNIDPDKRFTIQDMRNHIWWKNFNDDNIVHDNLDFENKVILYLIY